MATFTITGQRDGRRISITWTDGALSGDAETVEWIEHLAAQLDGKSQRYGAAPATLHHHLHSPYSACGLIRSVFSGRVEQDQPLPPLDLPPGAIA